MAEIDQDLLEGIIIVIIIAAIIEEVILGIEMMEETTIEGAVEDIKIIIEVREGLEVEKEDELSYYLRL
jgi:flagellin-specific chaperone FliS